MDFWLLVRSSEFRSWQGFGAKQGTESSACKCPVVFHFHCPLLSTEFSGIFYGAFQVQTSPLYFDEIFFLQMITFRGGGLSLFFNRQFFMNLCSIRELSVKVVLWCKLHLACEKRERTSNFGSLSRRNGGISRAIGFLTFVLDKLAMSAEK